MLFTVYRYPLPRLIVPSTLDTVAQHRFPLSKLLISEHKAKMGPYCLFVFSFVTRSRQFINFRYIFPAIESLDWALISDLVHFVGLLL